VKSLNDFVDKHIVVVLVVPGLVLYTLFLILPVLGTISLGFTKWEGINIANIKFVGLNNYIELIQDKIFWRALSHNLIFVCIATVIQFFLSLLLALSLNMGLRFTGFFKGVIFIPQVLAFIGIAFLFKFIFAPLYAQGLLNNFLVKIGLKSLVHAWLGDKSTVLFTIIGVHIWRETGFTTMLLLAGLATIPQSLYDASKIDGAGRLRTVWDITLPMLREINIVVITLAVIYALRVFEYIFAMTGGGPNYASEVIATYLYREAFEGGKMGYSCAISTVFFFIMTTFTIIYLKITKAGSMRL